MRVDETAERPRRYYSWNLHSWGLMRAITTWAELLLGQERQTPQTAPYILFLIMQSSGSNDQNKMLHQG